MFRNPRGSILEKDMMTEEETNLVLGRNCYCTMALNGPEGYPSAYPMNYAWDGSVFYLHCNGMTGEKLERLRQDGRVCITVYESAEEVGSAPLGMHRSIMAYGTAEILSGEDAVEGLRLISLAADMPFKATDEYIYKRLPATVTVRVTPVHLTGRRVIFGALPGAKKGDPVR